MFIKVEIPKIGTFVMYHGNRYVVLSTTTYQEQDTEIWTSAQILPISDNGDDVSSPDNPVMWVQSSLLIAE